jgi:hypothetical protein
MSVACVQLLARATREQSGKTIRCAQQCRFRGNISDQTARHDLKTLRAAIRWYKREHDSSLVVPLVTMPGKAQPRMDYWLSRDEVARRIRIARKSRQTRHDIIWQLRCVCGITYTIARCSQQEGFRGRIAFRPHKDDGHA